MMEILLDRMDAMIEKMDANTKAIRTETEAIRARTTAMQDERIKANIYACQETSACQDAMEASLMEMKPNSGEKEAAVERQETPNEDVAIYCLRECRKETMACQETTEARQESESEHREVPNEYAVVKPVRGRRKRHRGRKQAAGRRGEPKKLTRGDCVSRKKLAAPCRKVSRSATVAWRKRNIFRKSLTQVNCGPRHEFAAGRNMTHRAGVARREGNFVSKYSTRDNIAPRTRTGQMKENIRLEVPECKNGVRSRVVEELLDLRKGRKTINNIGGWSRIEHPRLEIMGNTIQVFGKAIGLQFGKLADGSSAVRRNINNWILWRGCPPPKRKRVCIRSRNR
jgi:hypothetical protein